MNGWVLISFGTTLLYVLLAVSCMFQSERGRVRNYLAFVFVSFAGLAAAPYYNSAGLEGFHLILQTLSYSVANLSPVAAALLMFLLFEDRDISSLPFWGIAGLAIGIDSYDFWVSMDGNWPNDDLLIYLFEDFPQVAKLVYLLLAAYALLRSWRADLIQGRFRLRFVILVLITVIGLEMLLVENLLAVRMDLPYDSSRFHSSWQFLLAIGLNFLFLQPRSINWSSMQTLVPRPVVLPEKKNWVDWEKKKVELQALLDERQIYRDHEMNLASLAKAMAIPEYRARQLINIELGYKNFNVFLNDQRIDATARDLLDQNKSHLPILTIALDAGYQSISPFNKAFKKRKGVTPSEFRRSLGKSGSPES